MKIKEKEAVSPVIGVILMVAITVVLAAVLYVWVSGFMGGGAALTPVGALSAPGKPPGISEENSTTSRVIRLSEKVAPEKVKWFIYNLAGLTEASATFNSTYDEGNNYTTKDRGISVKLVDNDIDAKLSTNDIFVIYQDHDTIKTGFVFALIYGDTGGEIARTSFT